RRYMDSFRGFEEDGAVPAADEEPAIERPPEIGVDERRMHVRAYNYWVSLLAGRAYPAIQDVDPHNIEDFGPHSVLLDFSGDAVRAECGLDSAIRRISGVPGRSLLSRLTDHYLQIIANRAPIGFEAEFVNQRGAAICYRGILMPFSSDGDTIDFIYGLINWKTVGAQAIAEPIAAPQPEPEPVADEPVAEEIAEPGAEEHLVWE